MSDQKKILMVQLIGSFMNLNYAAALGFLAAAVSALLQVVYSGDANTVLALSVVLFGVILVLTAGLARTYRLATALSELE